MAYFRITVYHPQEDFSAILDANGKYEKLWEFSAFLVSKGLNIIAVCRAELIVPDTLEYVPLIDKPSDKIMLRVIEKGKASCEEMEYESRKCKIVSVGTTAYAQYIP